MGFKKEVMDKLERIDAKLEAQTVNLAINNEVLKEHHKRSTQLEARVFPLEHNHIFVNKLAKVVASIVALGAGIAAIYHYLIVPLK